MAYLLTANEAPSPAPVGFVEMLKQRVGEDDLIELTAPLEIGDKVRIGAGPFANHVGELVRMDASSRVEILLQLMNSVIRVKVARDLLERSA